MYSKTLSKADREDILALVKEKAEKKWEESPLQAEADALHQQMQEAITAHQLTTVPKGDQEVLAKYGQVTGTYSVGMGKNEARGVHENSFQSQVSMRITYLKLTYHFDKPQGHINSAGDCVTFLKNDCPDVLESFFDLIWLKHCEEDKTVAAFEKLLAECRTTKQVADNPALKQFLPKHLLEYKKPTPGLGPVTKTDAALIADLTAEEPVEEAA